LIVVMSTASTSETQHVAWRTVGRVAELTLDRERAINAVTLDMVTTIHSLLDDWAEDDRVESIVLRGAGLRGFSAGADIRWLAQASAFARYDFFDAEYALDLAIARHPKPIVAFMDGITMGAGVGLTAHSAFPVVTERSRVAMPEVRIGLMPDVGANFLLARAPGRLGHLLAYTAGEMTGQDAIAVGLARHFVPSDWLDQIVDGLAGGVGSGEAGRRAVRAVIADAEVEPPLSRLVEHQAMIDQDLADPDPQAVIDALRDRGIAEADELADTIAGMCPFSLAVERHALDLAAGQTLEQVFDTDLRVCSALTARPDFREGVRAQVIDKDRSPVWNPARLSEVDPDDVRRVFGAA
jgi:enoyl-CoA hydratase